MLKLKVFFILSLVFLFVSCSFFQNSKKSSSKIFVEGEGSSSVTREAPWIGQMRVLADRLIQLYPLIYEKTDQSHSSAETNRAQILALSKEIRLHLSEIKEILNQKFDGLKKKTLGFTDVSSSFESELLLAEHALEQRHDDYAKSLYKGMTQYCIQCHSQGIKGSSFSTLESESIIKKLDSFSQAQLLVSLHQYDKAYELYNSLLADSKNKNDFYLERIFKNQITIAVRFLNSKENVRDVFKKIQIHPQISFNMKKAALSWSEDLKKWNQSEKSSVLSALENKKNAEEWILLVEKLKNKEAGSGSSFFRALMASHYLHGYAATINEENPHQRAWIQFKLGKMYDLLDEGVSQTSQSYYKACVYLLPHSPLALDCYNSYKDNVIFGYSGSRGLDLPKEISDYLKKLKSLAE